MNITSLKAISTATLLAAMLTSNNTNAAITVNPGDNYRFNVTNGTNGTNGILYASDLTSATDIYLGDELSILAVTNDPFFNPYGATTNIGEIKIEGGSKIINANTYVLGKTVNGVGLTTVDGAGSELRLYSSTDKLTVGTAGIGILNIQNGGKVHSYSPEIGAESTSLGQVTVTGANTTWTNEGTLIVGYRSGITNIGGTNYNSFLEILDGATVTSSSGRIAGVSSSTGYALVAGNNSSWTNSSNLTIGDEGNGALLITAGGNVSNGIASIGNQSGGTGTVIVNGTGSTWSNSSLNIGGSTALNGGTGTLYIENNGAVTSALTTTIWNSGTINLTSGTLSTPRLTIQSAGTLNIENTAHNINTNQILDVKSGAHLNLTGTASLNLNGGTFKINDYGTFKQDNNSNFSFNSGTVHTSNLSINNSNFNITANQKFVYVGGQTNAIKNTSTIQGAGSKLTLHNGTSLNITRTLDIHSGGKLDINPNATLTGYGNIKVGQTAGAWSTVNLYGNTSGYTLKANTIELDRANVTIQDTDVKIEVFDKFEIQYSGFFFYNSSNFQNANDQWNLEFQSTGGSSPTLYVEQNVGIPNALALTKAKITVKSGSNLSLEAYSNDSVTSFGGNYGGFIDEILLEDYTSLTLYNDHDPNEAVYVDHLALETINTSFYSSSGVNLYYNTISMADGSALPGSYTLPSFVINFSPLTASPNPHPSHSSV